MLAPDHTHKTQLEKCLSYLLDCVSRITETPQLRGQQINGGQPFKIPPYFIFRPKCSRNSINICSHFHAWVSFKPIMYEYFKCIIMVGTHSEVYRGQMSQICDISPLRVNLINAVANFYIWNHIHCSYITSLEKLNC